jgi:hypothetical protein
MTGGRLPEVAQVTGPLSARRSWGEISSIVFFG